MDFEMKDINNKVLELSAGKLHIFLFLSPFLVLVLRRFIVHIFSFCVLLFVLVDIGICVCPKRKLAADTVKYKIQQHKFHT